MSRAACIKVTVVLMVPCRSHKRHDMFIELKSSSQSVVHMKSSMCMKEGNGLVQRMRTLFVDDDVICRASAGIEEEGVEDVKESLNMFPKHGVEIQDDLVKQDCRNKALHRSFETFINLCRKSSVCEQTVSERISVKEKFHLLCRRVVESCSACISLSQD